MRTIQADIEISAPAESVWDVLADSDEYADWNPFIISVTGKFEPGSRPVLSIRPPGKRAMTFRPSVTHASPETGLRWKGRLLLPGLCDAEHEFLLAPTRAGGTRLTQRETFRGLLVPMLGGMMQPTLAGFTAMNAALARRVEQRLSTDAKP